MNIDVASARATKRRGGSSDYDYCARESHTAALRVALCPRGLEGCIIQVPHVDKLRHSKVVVSRQ